MAEMTHRQSSNAYGVTNHVEKINAVAHFKFAYAMSFYNCADIPLMQTFFGNVMQQNNV